MQRRVDAVVQPDISEERKDMSKERKRELYRIAEQLCKDFDGVLEGANREDDCVEPIRSALVSMDSDTKFDFPRKAGMSVLPTGLD
jgi:hypothetical protein